MGFFCLGVDYKIAQIKDIEPLILSKSQIPDFYSKFKNSQSIQGLIILSTCNRFECYISASNDADAENEFLDTLASFHSIAPSYVQSLLKKLTELESIHHLFNVSSGIHSMVIGEDEILAQVKGAYALAQSHGITDSIANKIFQMAIACGKRVRTETTINHGSYSVSSIGIEAIRQECLDYFGRNILILGCGIMGSRAFKKLNALGHPSITLTNRTLQRAYDLAQEDDCQVIPFEKALQTMGHYDIIVSAVTVTDPILISSLFDQSSRTSLVIDLGVPRNADPQLMVDQNMTIYTVSDLQEVAAKSMTRREGAIIHAQQIVLEDVAKMTEWAENRQKFAHV